MIFRLLILVFPICLFGQIGNTSIADKDTIVSKKRLLDFVVGEFDTFRIKDYQRDEQGFKRDSFFFRRQLGYYFRELLGVETAYIKIEGKVPDKFLQYHCYLARWQGGRGVIHTYANQDLNETLLTVIQDFYDCKIYKVQELTDVYIIYPEPVFSVNECKDTEYWEDNGDIHSFRNDYLGFGHIMTNATGKIVFIDEKFVDNKIYQMYIPYEVEISIEKLQEFLPRFGLKVVKEKRVTEFYRIDFAN